MDEILEKLSE